MSSMIWLTTVYRRLTARRARTLARRSEIERIVLTNAIAFAPMNHANTRHAGHCSARGCAMSTEAMILDGRGVPLTHSSAAAAGSLARVVLHLAGRVTPKPLPVVRDLALASDPHFPGVGAFAWRRNASDDGVGGCHV